MTSNQATSPQPPAAEWSRLADMISGFQRSQMVYVAAQLGLADLLAEGPRSAEDLATATDTQPRSLWRLMRTLAGYGIFSMREDGRFELNPAGSLLRDGVAGSLRPMALVAGNDNYRTWGQLLHCIRTGQDGFALAYGKTGPEYRDDDPVANKNFNDWMAETARRRASAFLQAYSFADSGTVVDVGGGNGMLLASILRQYPGLHGVLFDLPRVVADVEQVESSVRERLTIQAGSFFDGVPADGDYYVLSLILHNWPDEAAIAILRNARAVIKPTAKLVVLEQVVPEGPYGSMSDLNMLVACGAQERTEREWRDLLRAGGFEVTSIGERPPYIEASPA